jgi:hypothetical protein
MEDRESSSPVCYLDFDQVLAPTTKRSVQDASSPGETGALVANALVTVTPGPLMDASVASPPAAPVAAPPLRSTVAGAVESNPASNKAQTAAATESASCEKLGRGD